VTEWEIVDMVETVEERWFEIPHVPHQMALSHKGTDGPEVLKRDATSIMYLGGPAVGLSQLHSWS
jgi:hypothetical protein